MLLRIFFFAKLTAVLVKLASAILKLPNAFVKLQVCTKNEKTIISKQLSNGENKLVDKSKQLSNRYCSPTTHPSTPFNNRPPNTLVEHRNARDTPPP
jgi:hypothetical protein